MKIKLISFLLLTIFYQVTIHSQTLNTVTLTCFRDLNNNGVMEINEPVLNNRFRLLIGDSISNAYSIDICGGATVFTVNTVNNAFRLYNEYEMHTFSNFWTKTIGNSLIKFRSPLLNTGGSHQIPIPVGFGEMYLPVSGYFFQNTQNNCLNDSSYIQLLMGNLPWDTTCIANNTYSYNCNNGAVINFEVNNLSIDTYTVSNCGYTMTVGNNSFSYFFNNTFYLHFDNTLLSSGTNTVKLTVSAASGYTQPSVSSFTINNNFPFPCGQFKAKAYIDCNQNCIKDPGELYGTQNNNISVILSNNTNTYVLNGASNGNFQSGIPYGNYSVTINPPALCNLPPTLISIPNNTTYLLPLANTYSVPNYYTYNSICCGFPGPGAVPGGTITSVAYLSNYQNQHCSTATSSPNQYKLVIPSEMYYLGTLNNTPIPSTVIVTPSEDTIVWNLTNPGPLTSFNTALGIYTTAIIGNFYQLTTIVSPNTDMNSLDNTYTFTLPFGGPYDPNNKLAENSNMLLNGNIPHPVSDLRLKYTINFQNLGNGPALNVLIRDTIDNGLDLSSLKILSSNYPVNMQINALTREAVFRFDSILLPPGAAQDYSNRGFVTYSVNMLATPSVGNTYNNRAYIYFDYNTAIITNQTSNTIVTTQNIKEYERGPLLTIYPNPAKSELYISDSEQSTISYKINDLLGNHIKSGTCKSYEPLRINEFKKGIYIITITKNGNNIIHRKFIKD